MSRLVIAGSGVGDYRTWPNMFAMKPEERSSIFGCPGPARKWSTSTGADLRTAPHRRSFPVPGPPAENIFSTHAFPGQACGKPNSANLVRGSSKAHHHRHRDSISFQESLLLQLLDTFLAASLFIILGYLSRFRRQRVWSPRTAELASDLASGGRQLGSRPSTTRSSTAT